MIYTYLLHSKKRDVFYCGITNDVRRRVKEHNTGGGVEFTKRYGPWSLVYVKAHDTYIEARKHEKWLKKKNHDYKNKLVE